MPPRRMRPLHALDDPLDLDPEYGGAAHVLKGKTLTVLYDWTSSNLDGAARKWLKHLK